MNFFISLSALSFLFGIGSSVFASSGGDFSAAKGYCFFQGQRIVMKRSTTSNPYLGWKADLRNSVSAEVEFKPGYGMTFVTLLLKKAGKNVSNTTMWVEGSFGADSVSSTLGQSTTGVMEQFNALSLNALVDRKAICCEYNFFGEREFQGDPNQACPQSLER